MIHDLHMHSTASDGSLSPVALLELARSNGVDVLSITDHDTVDGYAAIRGRVPDGLTVIPGVELSTAWMNRGVHIVGLAVDLDDPTLMAGLSRQSEARAGRAEQIAERLAALGIDCSLDAVREIAGGSGIGRPHFARHLVDIGAVRDTGAAFRKYLGTGKAGDVRQSWATLDEVVGWIRASGGQAVLAHPAKYGMTMRKLAALLDDFMAAGGTGIEVVCGRQDAATTRRMAALAADYGLLASTGSDFHSPEQHWSRPGGFDPLPAGLEPVWTRW